MMYAVVSKKTGVIRRLSYDRDVCIKEKDFNESFGDPCVLVEVPQLMLDDFGAQLLALHKEEVSE